MNTDRSDQSLPATSTSSVTPGDSRSQSSNIDPELLSHLQETSIVETDVPEPEKDPLILPLRSADSKWSLLRVSWKNPAVGTETTSERKELESTGTMAIVFIPRAEYPSAYKQISALTLPISKMPLTPRTEETDDDGPVASEEFVQSMRRDFGNSCNHYYVKNVGNPLLEGDRDTDQWPVMWDTWSVYVAFTALIAASASPAPNSRSPTEGDVRHVVRNWIGLTYPLKSRQETAAGTAGASLAITKATE